jgi:hypothetical protein
MLTAKEMSWKGMNTHIEQFMLKCGNCQKAAYKTPAVRVVPSTASSEKLMISRSVDTLGSFQEDDDEYKHIVTKVYKFTYFNCL